MANRSLALGMVTSLVIQIFKYQGHVLHTLSSKLLTCSDIQKLNIQISGIYDAHLILQVLTPVRKACLSNRIFKYSNVCVCVSVHMYVCLCLCLCV